MSDSFNIIGIGEILWDLLPVGKRLGGAPANFAYVANALGDNGIVLSRVGDDDAGKEILAELQAKNLSIAGVQTDPQNPTGAVKVTLRKGQPSYEIVEPVAWDFLEMSEDWRELAARADVVCFGTLAQRNSPSTETIHKFIGLTKKWRIFDVNLRQHFFSPEILLDSLSAANVVKFNHEELPVVAEMFDLKKQSAIETARNLLAKLGSHLICVTRGANGSLLVTDEGVSDHAGIKIEIADAIGAGDAFTAALAHGLLRGWELDKINEFANRVGAFVASQTGAMPVFPEELKQ